ncbi:HlyD family secretion protein [Pseudomonas soli]|uniref:HlyD family secretion protein n=1 Tax=Pseudomonas soli TaxID=1306993 RepID=UPI00382AA52B
MHRRLLLLAIPFTLIAAALRWYPGQAADTTPTNGQSHWVRVEPQYLESRLGLVGRLQAVDQVTLAAPFDGLLAEVRVQEGQRVEQGQVLLSLDPAQVMVQMRQAKAELLKAQREAQRLQQWNNGPEVGRARRALANARQVLASSEGNLRDTRALFERGIVARMEVESQGMQVRNQQQDLAAASDELATTLAQGQGEARQIAEMELANAQARHQAIEALYARREVTAPLSGHVVRPAIVDGSKPVLVQPGLAVTQGMPLIGVIGQERFQALTRVEETDLHLLREGMPVHIAGDGFTAQLSGRIQSIGIQSDATELQAVGAHYEVKVSVDLPEGGLAQPLRAGMSTQLAVILYQDEQGMAVPPQALRQGTDGATYVMYRAMNETSPEHRVVIPGVPVAQGVTVQGLAAGFVEVPAP